MSEGFAGQLTLHMQPDGTATEGNRMFAFTAKLVMKRLTATRR